jgi:hypothetical protein
LPAGDFRRLTREEVDALRHPAQAPRRRER